MGINIYELSDNRILGTGIFEIMSFPQSISSANTFEDSSEKAEKIFLQIATELYKMGGNDSALEFLWITESVQNQTFMSQIHIYSIIRKIGFDKDSVKYSLSNIQTNLMQTLTSISYTVQEVLAEDKVFLELLSCIEGKSIFAITKAERYMSNLRTSYPYYYSDLIPTGKFENFTTLVSTLSQMKDCCISFQIFPTEFTMEEKYLIGEIVSDLTEIVCGTTINGQAYKDINAGNPLKFYSYYNEHQNTPLFSYNILVFGERAVCSTLATKVISLLQSGREKRGSAEFSCFDLSQENIRLRQQLPYYVWNTNKRLVHHYRNMELLNSVPLAKKLYRLPYLMSVEEINSIYRLPLHEHSMTAIKSTQIAQTYEQFSAAVTSEDNIKLGELSFGDSSKIAIGCSEKSFTKHALVVGTPGSGKTTFSVNLLLQFTKKQIPFLAIEPTKTEYRAMIEAIPNIQIFTPGNNSVSPYIINPFIPPKGIRVEQYIPSLASAFEAAFSMPAPLDMIFLKAIRSCYIQYGWKDYSKYGDEDVTVFGLYEFILVFKKLIENTTYSKEVKSNIESAGLLRLTNLIEQNSNIYDTINTVPMEDLLTKPTVLELNAIDNVEQKSLIIALLLINICIYTKHNHIGDGELKNVILVDEAHVLLAGNGSSGDGSDSQGKTVKALQDMIAEIRSYGTSIIIADQSPTKVSREVVANTDIKVSFRLVQSAEKSLIADSTNMNAESQENLSRLKPGEAYVYYSKLDSPQLVITEDIREKEGIRLSVSDEEIASRMTYWNEKRKLLKPYKECDLCSYCHDTCDFSARANAEYIANFAFGVYRSEIKNDVSLKKCVFHLPTLMKTKYQSYEDELKRKIQICSRIKLIRKVLLELPIELNERDIANIIVNFPTDGDK